MGCVNPPAELWALVDRHGVLVVFTDETKMATHVAGIEPHFLQHSEVVRYVVENGVVSRGCDKEAAE